MTTDISSSRALNSSGQRWLLLATMCVGMFLVQLDVTVVNVALPTIRRSLHTGLAGQQWIVDGYSVALAGFLLAGGAIGDRYGYRRVILAGLGLFGFGSLGCGLAPNIGVLVGLRVIQGSGAALLLPGTLAVITRSFPNRVEQARAVGIWAGVSALALPAGPLLGGALVSWAGWRFIFFVNLPLIAAGILATVRLLTETQGQKQRDLDLGGTALSSLALAASVYAVITAGGDRLGFRFEAAAGIAVIAAVGFVIWEHRVFEPLLPPSLMRFPAFVGANLVAGAMNLVGLGTVFVATLYLQTVRHHSAFIAGVMLLPLFVPLAVLAPVTGRIIGRFGPRAPMTAGLAVGAAGSLALLLLTTTSSYLQFLPSLLGLGVGMGLLTAAVVSAAVRAVPPERAGLASGVNNTARQAAGALGIAVYGAIAGSPTRPNLFVAGLHILGTGAAVLWLIALALTWIAVRPNHQQITLTKEKIA